MSISSDNVGLDHRNPSPATRKGKCRRVDHSKVTRIPVDILEDIKTDFSLYMLKTDVMPEEHDTVAEAVVDKILSQQNIPRPRGTKTAPDDMKKILGMMTVSCTKVDW
ncbi:hypothetical protein SERLA73DRAFT_75377 [Serpula lacrymans var. lacrymans S7.3]|uniref:Uncharacterized protein n=1 Tax=Serpula lacrymans var. lacrymans (strain S7.3) TaxID=936435 RepID=F8Q3H0_SERL3|nr:hypothetical protein SERLA73DRAFT_75377 [Serpula lacrymans var. lacrymans S7.3]